MYHLLLSLTCAYLAHKIISMVPCFVSTVPKYLPLIFLAYAIVSITTQEVHISLLLRLLLHYHSKLIYFHILCVNLPACLNLLLVPPRQIAKQKAKAPKWPTSNNNQSRNNFLPLHVIVIIYRCRQGNTTYFDACACCVDIFQEKPSEKDVKFQFENRKTRQYAETPYFFTENTANIQKKP